MKEGNLMNIKGIPNINHYATMMAKQAQVRNKANEPDEKTNPVKKDIVDTVEITAYELRRKRWFSFIHDACD